VFFRFHDGRIWGTATRLGADFCPPGEYTFWPVIFGARLRVVGLVRLPERKGAPRGFARKSSPSQAVVRKKKKSRLTKVLCVRAWILRGFLAGPNSFKNGAHQPATEPSSALCHTAGCQGSTRRPRRRAREMGPSGGGRRNQGDHGLEGKATGHALPALSALPAVPPARAYFLKAVLWDFSLWGRGEPPVAIGNGDYPGGGMLIYGLVVRAPGSFRGEGDSRLAFVARGCVAL